VQRAHLGGLVRTLFPEFSLSSATALPRKSDWNDQRGTSLRGHGGASLVGESHSSVGSRTPHIGSRSIRWSNELSDTFALERNSAIRNGLLFVIRVSGPYCSSGSPDALVRTQVTLRRSIMGGQRERPQIQGRPVSELSRA
jgi:hypothetical protein